MQVFHEHEPFGHLLHEMTTQSNVLQQVMLTPLCGNEVHTISYSNAVTQVRVVSTEDDMPLVNGCKCKIGNHYSMRGPT